MFTCLQTDNNCDGFKYGTVGKAFMMKMKVFVLVIVCPTCEQLGTYFKLVYSELKSQYLPSCTLNEIAVPSPVILAHVQLMRLGIFNLRIGYFV